MSEYSGSYREERPRYHPPIRSASEPQYLALPKVGRRKTPPLHQGDLNLPSDTVLSIKALFKTVFAYITADGKKPGLSDSPSLPRLRVLTEPQLLELVTDICDEIGRREPELHGEPCHEAFLQPNADFTDSRNQSRQKLATLRTAWFHSLAVDVWTELRRRHVEFTKDEVIRQSRHQQQPDANEMEESDDVDGDVHGSVISIPVPVPVQVQHHHQHLHPSHAQMPREVPIQHQHQHAQLRRRSPSPPPQPSREIDDASYDSYDDSKTEIDTVYMEHTSAKPSWLIDAEERVRKHLGPGRSSHDYLHCDRVRRAAVSIARMLNRKSAKLDLMIIELSALFTCACNDPKHAVKDAKDFVRPFSKAQHGLLDKDQENLIVRIVRTVGVKKEERRRNEKRETSWHKSCRELHCVQDADKLEMLGCFGILRTAATFGTTHKSLYSTSDPHHAASNIMPGNAVAHFLEKEKLIHMMRTVEGKAIGEKRFRRMVDFARDCAEEFELADLA